MIRLGSRQVPREGAIWLLAALGISFTGWLKSINLIMLLGHLMLAVWFINALRAGAGIRRLSAVRLLPDQLTAGVPFAWEVDLTNTAWGRVGSVHVEERGPDGALAWFVHHLAGGQTLRLRRTVTPTRRGRQRWEPLRVGGRQPFGLVERTVTPAPSVELIVWPRRGRLPLATLRKWLERHSHGESRSVRPLRRNTTREADVHGVRVFRSGDSPRWIHWKTTARRNQLMVREFEEGVRHDLVVILLAHAGPDLEAAISLTASICWECGREPGDRLLLGLADGAPRILNGRTGRELTRVTLDALAEVTGQEPPDVTALAEALRRERLPDGPVVLIASDASTAPTLARAIGRPVVPLDPRSPPSFYTPPG